MKFFLIAVSFLAFATAAFPQRNSSKGENSRPGASETSLAGAVGVEAQLQKQLDLHKAQVGDSVALKATKTVKQNGQTVVTKGSTIFGRITEVKRNVTGKGGSAVTMIFDRLQSGGTTVPVNATVVSISNLTATAAVDDALASEVSGSSRTSGSASSSGGLVGGLGNTVGGVVGTATQAAGGTLNAATQTTSNLLGVVGRSVNGLQISTSASGSASGSSTLSTSDKNVRLEKGATFNLAVSSRTMN